jgi:hypothetical protein
MVDLSRLSWSHSGLVITLLLHLLRLLPFLIGDHRQLALENLAFRQQLAVSRRTLARPQLRTTDRLFWAGLAIAWTGWRQALVIVPPETVLRWQRRRFREHWTRLSARRSRGGRPPVSAEIAALVRTMATANPLWGAPRIHGRVEGWRGTSGPAPAPATSNGANGFPVRRSPAGFTPRVMRPIGWAYFQARPHDTR